MWDVRFSWRWKFLLWSSGLWRRGLVDCYQFFGGTYHHNHLHPQKVMILTGLCEALASIHMTTRRHSPEDHKYLKKVYYIATFAWRISAHEHKCHSYRKAFRQLPKCINPQNNTNLSYFCPILTEPSYFLWHSNRSHIYEHWLCDAVN